MDNNEGVTQTPEDIDSKYTIEGHSEWEHQMDVRLKTALMLFIGMFGTVIVAWILGGPLGSFMESIQTSFLYHLIPFILSTSFFTILVYRAYIQNIKGLGFLATAVLLHGISEFFFMISNPEGAILFRNGNQLAMIGDLMFPLAIILLYLHIELTDKNRPTLSHAIGIIGTAAPLIIGGVFLTVFANTKISFIATIVEEVEKVVIVYLGLFALIILWIALFSFKVMYNTLVHADSAEIALSSSLVLVAFSAMLTNFLLLGVNYSTILLEALGRENTLLLSGIVIHNVWLVTFALIIIILAYILTPRFSYSVPFDVYQLVCIQADIGVTLFSFVNEIRSEKGSTHDALQSATIVAIQNLVQEIAAAEGNIMVIGLEDRIIVFRSRGELVTVLITERNSYFMNRGLEEFTDAFYEMFQEDIKNFTGNTTLFNEANLLVRRYLPFMREESLI